METFIAPRHGVREGSQMAEPPPGWRLGADPRTKLTRHTSFAIGPHASPNAKTYRSRNKPQVCMLAPTTNDDKSVPAQGF